MNDDEPTGSPLIAVVDDASSLHAIVALVGPFGYAASKFSSTAEFLGSLQVNRAACLIADVQMPDMTGLELHQRQAANDGSILTILTTAYPNEATRIGVLKVRVLCYLVKPVGPTICSHALARRRHEGAMPKRTS
jgi:FixJ family two-component response regulator